MAKYWPPVSSLPCRRDHKIDLSWRMPKELHRAHTGPSERVRFPSSRAPIRQTTADDRGGGGTPKLFLTSCRQDTSFYKIHPSRMQGGTTFIMSRSWVRSPPLLPWRSSSAVEHVMFHLHLVARDQFSRGMPVGLHRLNRSRKRISRTLVLWTNY